jgi:FkbM family methyltransferase
MPRSRKVQVEYFGQWQQDKVLNEEIFRGKRDGLYVEIGCASPVRLSNSYFFEKELAWKGVCIDARKAACEEFAKVRSAKVVNAAIGPVRGKSVFMDFGLLAGLVRFMGAHEHDTIEKFTTDRSKVNAYWVDVVPFADIRATIPAVRIDLLMIDTEGAELPILKSMETMLKDFSVVMTESNTKATRLEVEDYVTGQGFVKYRTVGMDDIFINGDSDIQAGL